MDRAMMEFLACPIDKHFPLELFEIVSDAAAVKDGVLWCPECARYYPIIGEIPRLLPDDLRDRQKDISFLEQWQQRLPDKILKEGKPWHP